MRYLLRLAYNGKDYHGWQKQPNAITVQETLENAIALLLKNKVQVVGCGRTDTGVHAKSFFAHFDIETHIENPKQFVQKLNSLLDNSIAVQSIKLVEPDFHARFSAVSRTYKYYILTAKDPFLFNYAWCIYYDLDIKLMEEALKILFKHNDFTSFSKLHTDVKTNNCQILQTSIYTHKQKLIIEISADRFLRNMVRAIVGTLVDVGKRKITANDFEDIILAKNRSLAGQSAPAKGLFLTDVKY